MPAKKVCAELDSIQASRPCFQPPLGCLLLVGADVREVRGPAHGHDGSSAGVLWDTGAGAPAGVVQAQRHGAAPHSRQRLGVQHEASDTYRTRVRGHHAVRLRRVDYSLTRV